MHLTHLDTGKNYPERSSNQPDGRAENSLGHLLDLKVATLSTGLKELGSLSVVYKMKGFKARVSLSAQGKKKRQKSLFKYVEVGEQQPSKWVTCKGLKAFPKTT